jgi:hypothetical protein
MSKGLKLSREEKQSLEKVHDATGWRFSVAVKEQFNAAGKLQKFATEYTEAESNEQKAAIRGLLGMSEDQSTLALLKATDIFLRVARRVGDDKDLATLLPAGKFNEKDAETLEKCELKSLAAVVRARI